MKILFVIVPDNDKGRYIFKKKNYDNFIVLAIASAAAVLKEDNHEINAIDLRMHTKPKLILLEKINSFKPDIIHLSGYFVSVEKIKEYSFFLKKNYSIPQYFGGIYPSLYPITNIWQDIKLDQLEKIDVLIKGEETYFKEILAKGKSNELLENIENLPVPDFGIFEISKYFPLPKHYKKMPVIPLLTSRGCTWGKCSFCSQSKIKKYYRKMSPKKAVSLVKACVNKYSAKEIRFWDDTFFHSREWILEFCDLLKKEKLDLIWSCHERASMASLDILVKMKEAGCWQILFGIESGNEDLLKQIDKGINLKQAVNAVQNAKKAGIESRVSFILGLPNETPKMTDETIRFAKNLNADITQFSLFTPYPGTKLNKSYESKFSKNYRSYSEIDVIYLPKGYKSKNQLMKKYKSAYMSIYLNPGYMINALKRIQSIDDLRRNISGFKTMLGLALKRK